MYQLSKRVGILFLSAVACSCGGQIDRLQSQIDQLNKNVKDLSDVGAMSELGWVSKMLRDSASGTPAEQAKARADAARLFGMNEADLGNAPFFEVTVQVTGYDLTPTQQLDIATKYLNSGSAKAAAEFFQNVAGSGWQPYSLRSPEEYLRNEAQIKALVTQRVNALISGPVCQDPTANGDSATSGSCSLQAFSWAKTVPYPVSAPTEDANAFRANLVSGLVSAILAPTEIAGLPPSGARNGQRTVSWGLTGGAGTYLYVFIPQKQVKEHPKLKIAAWLHLRGFPDKYVGTGYQIEGVDFVQRCLGTVSPNDAPPVDSRSSAGPLCWGAFDLFGTGPRAQLEQMAREARLSTQQPK